MNTPFTASNRTIHLWAVGAMADYMLYLSFNALIMPIFTTAFGLSPVLVGWALMLPRITDAIIDPFVGHMSDITHTRWGRRRPFILGAALLGAVVVVSMWWVSRDWPVAAQFVWLLVSSILLFVCYGTFSMTHIALGYELSDDYNNRTKVVAVRTVYFSLASIGGGWAYWLALRPVFGNEITGVRWVAGGMAVIVLVAGMVPVLVCRERFPNANRKHVNIWQALRSTLHVRPFVLLLLLRFAQTLGTSLYGAVAFFIGVYSVCQGDKSKLTFLNGLGGMAGFLMSFALVPLAAPICRRLGKRWGIIVGYGAAFLGALVLPVFAQPGHPYVFFSWSLIFLPTTAILTMFMAAVMPDICDLDELNSGERREGLFSAVMSFVSKLENSVIMLIGGYLVTYAGFNAHLAQQPAEVLVKLRLFGFIPNIVFSGVAFAISWFVPLTQEMMDGVRAQLEERRNKTKS